MPELRWNEWDFLQCLGVPPEVEDYEVSHTYRVCKDGLCLGLTLWQIESMVEVSLSREGAGEPILSFALAVRGPVRRRDERWGEYLEFCDCIVVANRFSYLYMGDLFDRARYPDGQSVEVSVHPELRVGTGRH